MFLVLGHPGGLHTTATNQPLPFALSLAQNHPDTNIGVFLCGPKAISGILRRLAGKYTDTRKGGVRFHFEKENF